ncbi:MAG TPA: hypothetical protein VMD91_19740 [Candidatus Sulfotelmatobacter sp.]|nr:hypothetical protein [Candidatus Sulfotelmatobacter sp.]
MSSPRSTAASARDVAPREVVAAQPATLNVLLYPEQLPGASYPEQTNPRYSAASGKWGACFSGGGPRSCAASLGQMRGLAAAGVLPFIGAISCVSGGTWFGSAFTYARGSSVTELLGAYLEPQQITLDDIASVAPACLGAGLLNLSNAQLALFAAIELAWGTPHDKLWSRLINDTLLLPFGIASTSQYLSLDGTTVAAIVARNRSLSSADFLVQNADRPFFIAGGTYITQSPVLSPSGDLAPRPGTVSALERVSADIANLPGQQYGPFEYTAAYAGEPQLTLGQSGPFGGGFVENVGFAQQAPSAPPVNDVVTVGTSAYRFLLSDVAGSSSSAFASAVVEIGIPSVAPQFNYFAPQSAGTTPGRSVTIGDGGILENVGIVPLLRRGYRVVFAFVNSPYPIGSPDDGCVDGIDGQISRLFGHIPKSDFGNSQNTQIFPTAQWPALVKGLKAARAAGGTTVFADRYRIEQPNPFAIPPYPDAEPVQVFWLYNDLNQRWFDALPQPVRDLIGDRNLYYPLWNLPHFWTVFQNPTELLWYSPQQINLLAHMWAYAVKTGFTTSGAPFGFPLASEATAPI